MQSLPGINALATCVVYHNAQTSLAHIESSVGKGRNFPARAAKHVLTKDDRSLGKANSTEVPDGTKVKPFVP